MPDDRNLFYEAYRDYTMYAADADNICPAHCHESIELLYVVRGEKTVFVNNAELRLHAGDLLLCMPNDVHRYAPSDGGRQLCVTLPNDLTEEFRAATAHFAPATHVLRACPAARRLHGALDRIRSCDNRILRLGLANYVLGVLLDELAFGPASAPGSEKLLPQLIAWIDEHYAEPITLATLAARFGYSKNHFSTLFRKYMGAGLPAYVNSVRIRRSLPLLRSHKVSAVYFQCGFRSPQQYFAAFRRVYGCTPAQYLRASRPAAT